MNLSEILNPSSTADSALAPPAGHDSRNPSTGYRSSSSSHGTQQHKRLCGTSSGEGPERSEPVAALAASRAPLSLLPLSTAQPPHRQSLSSGRLPQLEEVPTRPRKAHGASDPTESYTHTFRTIPVTSASNSQSLSSGPNYSVHHNSITNTTTNAHLAVQPQGPSSPDGHAHHTNKYHQYDSHVGQIVLNPTTMEDVTRWKKRQRRAKKPASSHDDGKSNDDDDSNDGINGDTGINSDMAMSSPTTGNGSKLRHAGAKMDTSREEGSAPATSAATVQASLSLSYKAKKTAVSDDITGTSSSSSPSSSPTSSAAEEAAGAPSRPGSTETPPDEPSYERNADGKFRCSWPRCGKEFTVASRLTTHYRIHSGKPPYLCGYKDCQKAFHTSSSLSHHRVVHTDQGLRPYVCRHNRCGATYTQLARLITHQRTTHSGMILFIPQESGANQNTSNNPPQPATFSPSPLSPALSSSAPPTPSYHHAVASAGPNGFLSSSSTSSSVIAAHSGHPSFDAAADTPTSLSPSSPVVVRTTVGPTRIGPTPSQPNSPPGSNQHPVPQGAQAGNQGDATVSQAMGHHGQPASHSHPNPTPIPREQHGSSVHYPLQQRQQPSYETSNFRYPTQDQSQQHHTKRHQDLVADEKRDHPQRQDTGVHESQRSEGVPNGVPAARSSNGRHSRQPSGAEGHVPRSNTSSGRQTPTGLKMEEEDEETRLTKEVALAMTTFSERAMVQQQQQQQQQQQHQSQQSYGPRIALPTPAHEHPPRLEANVTNNSIHHQQTPAGYPPTPSPNHYSSYPFHSNSSTSSSTNRPQVQKGSSYQDSERYSGPYREDRQQYGAGYHHAPAPPPSSSQQQAAPGGPPPPHSTQQRPLSPVTTSRPPSRGAGVMQPLPHHHPYKVEGHTRSPSIPGTGTGYGYRPPPSVSDPSPSPGYFKDDYRTHNMLPLSVGREHGHERRPSGNTSPYGPASGGAVGSPVPPPTLPRPHQHVQTMADRPQQPPPQYSGAPPAAHGQHQRQRSYDMRLEQQQAHPPYPPPHSYGSSPSALASANPSSQPPLSPQGYRTHPPLPPLSQSRAATGYGARV